MMAFQKSFTVMQTWVDIQNINIILEYKAKTTHVNKVKNQGIYERILILWHWFFMPCTPEFRYSLGQFGLASPVFDSNKVLKKL